MPVTPTPPAGDTTPPHGAAGWSVPAVLEEIVPALYDELRALARRQLRREVGARSIQATEIVHEAYLKLSGCVPAESRAHFLSLAARAMRQVLVDHARRRLADKRGAGQVAVTLTDGPTTMTLEPEDMMALDRALEELDERPRRVVEYRFFAGFGEPEIAQLLGVSERTVRRDWIKARARLYRRLYMHGAL